MAKERAKCFTNANANAVKKQTRPCLLVCNGSAASLQDFHRVAQEELPAPWLQLCLAVSLCSCVLYHAFLTLFFFFCFLVFWGFEGPLRSDGRMGFVSGAVTLDSQITAG